MDRRGDVPALPRRPLERRLAWHDFFADYRPAPGAATPRPAEPKAQPAARPEPAGQQEPAAAVAQQPAAAKPAPAKPAPAKPAAAKPAPAAKAAPTKPAVKAPAPAGASTTPLRGVAAKIVQNMDASLSVPTATSVRSVPAKLLVDNRIVINNHLARGRGGKVSFTHLIGYAMVRALVEHPEMNNSFAEVDGKPAVVRPSTSTWASRST